MSEIKALGQILCQDPRHDPPRQHQPGQDFFHRCPRCGKTRRVRTEWKNGFLITTGGRS